MSLLEFKNVSFSYDDTNNGKRAVKGLSFKIEEGEFVAMLGHNGSGKSTVAKLMNALLIPTDGEVIVNGNNTKNEKTLFEIRKTVGTVFQNPDNQMIATIVEDDIAFGPENIGLSREEIGERIEFALKSVGMEKYRHATPFNLSGGQKQRIAIAGVLAIKPRLLVLDESTAMLDPKGRREVLNVIRKLNKEEGIAVVLITHYMDEAAEFDRVLVLNDGALVLEGTPREVFKEDRLLDVIGLKLPRPNKLAKYIKENGFDVGEVLTTEELLEGLCR